MISHCVISFGASGQPTNSLYFFLILGGTIISKKMFDPSPDDNYIQNARSVERPGMERELLKVYSYFKKDCYSQ